MSGYYDMDAMMSEVLVVVLVALLVVMLVALVYGLVTYIFQSLGMYTIAKRRGIKNPWMAWIPVCSTYLLGCIADQYQYVAKGKETSRRKILLGLAIASLVLSGISGGLSYSTMLTNMSTIMSNSYMSEEAMLEQMMGATMGIGGLSSLVSLLSLVMMVFEYIALYDLYSSCNPNNNVLFLVLSILLGFLTPFLIFACRNKDLGMPAPKKETPAPAVPETVSGPETGGEAESEDAAEEDFAADDGDVATEDTEEDLSEDTVAPETEE